MNIPFISNVGVSLNADSQNKITKKESTQGGSTKDILEQLNQKLNSTTFQNDQQKKAYEEKITQKIKAGAKLTASELNYLQENNPDLYMKAARMQMKREMMEQKLETCKSKEEVEDTVSTEIGSVSEKDPDREILINTISNVVHAYKKTSEYKGLPEKSKEESKNSFENKEEDSTHRGIDVRL